MGWLMDGLAFDDTSFFETRSDTQPLLQYSLNVLRLDNTKCHQSLIFYPRIIAKSSKFESKSSSVCGASVVPPNC